MGSLSLWTAFSYDLSYKDYQILGTLEKSIWRIFQTKPESYKKKILSTLDSIAHMQNADPRAKAICWNLYYRLSNTMNVNIYGNNNSVNNINNQNSNNTNTTVVNNYYENNYNVNSNNNSNNSSFNNNSNNSNFNKNSNNSSFNNNTSQKTKKISVNKKTSSAKITALDLPSRINAIIWSSNIILSKFEVQAGKSSALEIKDVKFGATVSSVAADFNNTVVSQVKLYKDSVSEKNLLKAKSSSDLVDGKITFDNVNVDVKKDSKVTLFVTVDVVDDTNLAGKTIKANTMALSDLTIEDSENDTVKATGTTLENARTVTIKGYGTITVTSTTNPENLDDIKDVVAGNSAIVAGFETTALQEAAVIKELTIGGVDVNAIKEIVLLDKDMKEVSKETVAGADVKFDNLSLNVKEGSDKIFVKVVTNKISKDRIGQAVASQKLTMTFVEVEGKDSGKDLVIPGVANAAATFNVVPVSVVVVKVSDAPKTLAVGTVLANVKFVNVPNDNTNANGVALKTYLKSIKVKATTFVKVKDVKINIRKKGWSTDLLGADVALTATDLVLKLPNTVKESDKEITSASIYEVVVKSYTVKDTAKNAPIELTLLAGADSVVLATDSALSNTVNVNINDAISFGISYEDR